MLRLHALVWPLLLCGGCAVPVTGETTRAGAEVDAKGGFSGGASESLGSWEVVAWGSAAATYPHERVDREVALVAVEPATLQAEGASIAYISSWEDLGSSTDPGEAPDPGGTALALQGSALHLLRLASINAVSGIIVAGLAEGDFNAPYEVILRNLESNLVVAVSVPEMLTLLNEAEQQVRNLYREQSTCFLCLASIPGVGLVSGEKSAQLVGFLRALQAVERARERLNEIEPQNVLDWNDDLEPFGPKGDTKIEEGIKALVGVLKRSKQDSCEFRLRHLDAVYEAASESSPPAMAEKNFLAACSDAQGVHIRPVPGPVPIVSPVVLVNVGDETLTFALAYVDWEQVFDGVPDGAFSARSATTLWNGLQSEMAFEQLGSDYVQFDWTVPVHAGGATRVPLPVQGKWLATISTQDRMRHAARPLEVTRP